MNWTEPGGAGRLRMSPGVRWLWEISLLGLLPLLHCAVKAHKCQGGTLAAVAFAATVDGGIHITQLTLSHLP